MKNKFYVTTPIYYVTARPHLGTLYSTLLADVAARWNKLQGKAVFFLTGTDEHGQKIANAAAQAGKDPKTFVDSFIAPYQDMWKLYHIEYDYFIRTTDSAHVAAVQQWIQQLRDKGDIYKAQYNGWYCISCETFVTEKDQVVNQAPKCPTCDRATVELAEESYFFRLSAYQDKLLAFYEQHPDFVIPGQRLQEVISFVKSGLKDLSISRTSITWGIPFPGDPKHVVYVWADALNNYITALGYGTQAGQKNFAQWWPADLQVMGKDIIRFHAVYWPAFLMASGLDLPEHLLVHGWIKMGDLKMSKSLGNAIDPEHLANQYGADAIRYYLIRQLAINQDGQFSIPDLHQRINADLVNDLGNLLNRAVTLANKYNRTQITTPAQWDEQAVVLLQAGQQMCSEYADYMNQYQYHMALAVAWKFIAQVNAYFHAQQPWKLAATDTEAFQEVLAATCNGLRIVATLLWPIMPQKMQDLLRAIGITWHLDKAYPEVVTKEWRGTFVMQHNALLFNKIDEPMQPEAVIAAASPAPAMTDITIDDFTKVQLMVGTIDACNPVDKSDKLFRLQVNFGPLGMRQILSGVRQHFTPEQLIGRQGVFVYNLKPRMMMGLESHGMMLFAADEHKKLVPATVAGTVPNGTRLS